MGTSPRTPTLPCQGCQQQVPQDGQGGLFPASLGLTCPGKLGEAPERLVPSSLINIH